MKERELEILKDKETDQLLKDTNELLKQSRVKEREIINKMKKQLVKDHEIAVKIKEINEIRKQE